MRLGPQTSKGLKRSSVTPILALSNSHAHERHSALAAPGRAAKPAGLGLPGPRSPLTTRQHVGGGWQRRQRGHGREAAGGQGGAGRGLPRRLVQPPRRGGEGSELFFPSHRPDDPPRPRLEPGGLLRSPPGKGCGPGLREGRGGWQARSGNGVGHNRRLPLTTTFVVVVASDVPVPGHDGGGRVARPLTLGRWA